MLQGAIDTAAVATLVRELQVADRCGAASYGYRLGKSGRFERLTISA